MFAGARRVRGRWTSEIAECKDVFYGIQQAQRFGVKKVILETDCQTIISRLRRTSADLADPDSILEDVLALSSYSDFID